MKITVPGSSARRALSSRAAPTSMAVCRSWPQACIAPGIREAYGRPVSSVTGSASMSPRSSTTGPALAAFPAPRSTAVTELSPLPVLISSGSPSSAASTFCWVFGRSRPISGSAWIACRSSAISPAMSAASLRSGTVPSPLVPGENNCNARLSPAGGSWPTCARCSPSLARLEATIAFAMLAERMPALARAGRVKRRNATTIRGPLHLPVTA